MKSSNIVSGFTNLITGVNKEVSDARTLICRKCPISKMKKGKGKYSGFCLPGNGGCKCFIPAKTSEIDESCPYGAWDKDGIYEDKIPQTINPTI